MVTFWKIDELVRRKIDADGETSDEKGMPFLVRYYRVFNVEQCDDLKALYRDDRKPVNPIAECESIADAKSALIFWVHLWVESDVEKRQQN
jgi:antirestriction protein ArdC